MWITFRFVHLKFKWCLLLSLEYFWIEFDMRYWFVYARPIFNQITLNLIFKQVNIFHSILMVGFPIQYDQITFYTWRICESLSQPKHLLKFSQEKWLTTEHAAQRSSSAHSVVQLMTCRPHCSLPPAPRQAASECCLLLVSRPLTSVCACVCVCICVCAQHAAKSTGEASTAIRCSKRGGRRWTV